MKYKILVLPEGRYLSNGESQSYSIYKKIDELQKEIVYYKSLTEDYRCWSDERDFKDNCERLGKLHSQLEDEAIFMSQKKALLGFKNFMELNNLKGYSLVEFEFVPVN